MSKVWFITGTSKGFGRIWAQAALERGDRVAATARDPKTLDGLVDQFGDDVLPLELDVTDREAVGKAVRAAHDRFGALDVVVNNAGYGHFGFVEELTEQEARDQIETNVFGALWVTQAALPFMREQRAGHILQVSSIGGVLAMPGLGAYHASKWALEAFSQSLAGEVAGFGINVTLIEPRGYATDWAGLSAVRSDKLEAYADGHAELEEQRKTRWSSPGDPEATPSAIFAVVDSVEPPLRLLLGDGIMEMITHEYEARIDTWTQWEAVSSAAV